MNGAQHYLEAERLLAAAAQPRRYITGLPLDDMSEEERARLLKSFDAPTVVFAGDGVHLVDQALTAAKVHAMLAQVAATIDSASWLDDTCGWKDAIRAEGPPDA